MTFVLKDNKYVHQATSWDYFIALAYYPDYLKQIDPSGKKYEKLHRWFVENENYLMDDDRESFTLLKLAEMADVKYANLAKWLKSMYDDIIDQNYLRPEKFRQNRNHLCSVSFDYLGKRVNMSLGLDVIPKAGEVFLFSFIVPQCGGGLFYVQSVRHKIDNNNHGISMQVVSNLPNKYSELLIDKAIFRNAISFQDSLFYDKKKLEEMASKIYSQL